MVNNIQWMTIMWLRTLSLSILLCCLGFASSNAKEYEIPYIKVEVSINPDGTVQVTEHLTYDFDGDFSWAEYKLLMKGFASISNIEISEKGQNYTNENSEAPGTFSVAKNNDAVKLKWHYNAEDEKRVFTISYTLEGALTVGPEWSQFYWNFLSDDRDKSTDQLVAKIILPNTTTVDSLYGWSRGPQDQIVLQKSTGSYKATATDINDHDFAKVRAVFPTRLLYKSRVEVNDQQFALAQAKQEEQAYQEKITKQRKQDAYLAALWEKLVYLFIILSIGFSYFLYNRYGKRHSTSHLSSTETIMIPGRLRPATVGWLLQGRNISSHLLMATVLDLARRGYFKLREEDPEEAFLSDNKPTFSITRTSKEIDERVTKWEKLLVNFIERRIQEEDKQKLHNIFKSGNSKVTSWFTEWKNSFKAYCKDKGWVDQESYTGLYWNLSIQFLLMSLSIVALVFTGPEALASLLITFLAFIFSFGIVRRTPKGEEVYHQWKNYEKGLKKAKEHNISSDKLDKHFIYAMAFGLKGKNIETLITTNTEMIPAFAWIAFSSDTTSVADVANSFSSLSATGGASFPGAGGGAGASASAAGGGASASAG
ncbi:DUF2207 domain-containing protein [Fodinibius halophilus]|uniref:DUF2207 domain-containing protein n=1 Tax=Fodinibius halophilus TaxID=1736908 RepID=A0A6M1SYV1_9BACT|nr:DUF2207 domain-containing protein [Fodinibius halophilus]NGP86799.1 DUF2207 domain-containing protein [Fodinibius halophilus]